MSYNMMMMHEKSKMRQIPRRCRPVAGYPAGRTRKRVDILYSVLIIVFVLFTLSSTDSVFTMLLRLYFCKRFARFLEI